MTYIIPTCIAATGIVIVQLHGAPFWVSLMGSLPLGIAISVFWETSSIWLWWRRDTSWKYQVAKYGTTLILLTGMIVQGIGPLLVAKRTANVGQQALRILESKIALKHWVADSTIGKAVAMTIGMDEWVIPPDWLPYLSWVPVIAFPLLYLLAILALVTLANERSADHSPNNNERSANPESLSTNIRKAMNEFAKAHGHRSQHSVAKAIGEHPSTLSECLQGKVSPAKEKIILEKLQ